MATCKATRKDGKSCAAQAQAGREYCFFHDPDKAADSRAAKSKGGSSGRATLSVVKPWRGEAGDVTVLKSATVPDLVNLLADTIDEVKTGKVDPRVANAVGYLAGVILKALEYDALNERLAALEEAVGVGGRRA
jgi:hypothetical protein